MRKIIMCMAAILFIGSGACPAQDAYRYTYIGLYADANHSSSCVTGTSIFYQADMWIWVLPGEAGFLGAEFRIVYPDNVIQTTVTNNPAIVVSLGSLVPGIQLMFRDCIEDWIWLCRQRIFVMNFNPSWIEIAPHPDDEYYNMVFIADCMPGYCAGLSKAQSAAGMRPT